MKTCAYICIPAKQRGNELHNSTLNREQEIVMKEQFEELIEGFMNNKVGISAQFVPAELARALQQNLLSLNVEGEMKHAGIGSGVSKVYDQQIRSDKIYWIDRNSQNDAEQQFLDLIEAFISYMNMTCYTGINAYEFHYALYEPGSFYKRHLDQFKNNSGRKFSLISYLNKDWNEADGGHLVVYRDNLSENILPTISKSVFFKSDELEHEVAISNRVRMSVTGWLKRV